MILSNTTTRKELKFKVFFKDINKFYSWLLTSSFKKTFYKRGVNSLYYDTPNLDFASSNISGESKRIKIRARWYTKLNEDFSESFVKDNQVFRIEIKRKLNNLSDKIEFSKIFFKKKNSMQERKLFLKTELKSNISNNPTLSKNSFQDIIFICYNREYYEHFLSSDIRLTIDSNIFCSDSTVSKNLNKSIISSNFFLVELKFKEFDNSLIKKIMNEFPFRQVRSSKYLYGLSKYKRFSY